MENIWEPPSPPPVQDGKLKNPDKNPLLSQGNMETPEVGIKEERELNKGTVSAQWNQENFALPEEITSLGILDDLISELMFGDVLELELNSEETSNGILNNSDESQGARNLAQENTAACLDPTAASQYVIDVSSYTDNLHAQEEIKADKVTVTVVERDTCKKSENTGIHVKIGNWMTVKLEYDEMVVNGDIYCLAHLQRTNLDSQDRPVNVVCNKHVSKSNSLPNHVLQTRATSRKYYPGSDKTNSGVFEIVNPEHKTLEYKFVCFDTCQTNAEVEKLKEKDRDMNLVLTLLQRNGAGWEIFARKHVSLWIKAAINNRDLNKKIRRGEKGGRSEATKRSASPIEEDETIRRKYLKFLQDNNFTHDDIDRVMKPKSKKSGENKVPKDKKPGEKKVPKDKKPKKPITPGAAGCLKKPLARVTDFTLKTEDTVNTDPEKFFENELGNAVNPV